MIPCCALKLKQILGLGLLALFSSPLWALDNLYVFVFKEGSPQAQIEVSVGAQVKETNEFGLANFSLEADEYEIGYYQNGELFALTEISLLENLQSQVFLNLSQSGAEVELDLPLAAYDASFDVAEIQQQEGPKGTLQLTFVDSRTEAPVAGARLFFRGYSVEGTTDANGVAEVELAEGVYDVSVIHPSYIMRMIRDLEVSAETITTQTEALTQSDIALDDFVVTAPFVEGSLASTISEIKDSDVLGDAISSEQFSKSGDSSASGALKRVTGITIVNGKYVYIRGLGERYSTVLLNDLHIPSPEPTKRVVPLDIFPTGVIQSMDIQKTWSANLPGTFGGGTVLIKTKDIPEEDNYISGSFSLNYNDATGSEVSYGADNATPLPAIILDLSNDFGVLTEEVKLGNLVLAEGLTAAQKQDLNEAMVSYRGYGLDKKTLEPGNSFSVSAGQSFKTSGGLKYGFAGTLYSTQSADSAHIVKDEYQYNPANDSNLHIRNDEYDSVKFKAKTGALASLALDNQEGHELKYTLLTLTEEQETTNFGNKDRILEDDQSQRTFLQYTEQTLNAHQFNGRHALGDANASYWNRPIIEWGVETAEATRVEPGTFEYEYKKANSEYVVDAKKLFYLYSDLQDTVDNLRLDVTLPFVRNQQENYSQFGWFNYSKSRNLDNRRFKIKYDNTLDPSPIDTAISESNVDNGTLNILDSYKPDDFYTAKQDVTALYWNQLYSPLEQLDLLFGLRSERSTQALRVGQEQEDYQLQTDDVLPSFALTYRMDEDKQLRFGFSQTISRPDFREFSPNRYKDPLTGNIIFGYEALRYTTITNLDLKLEWYPNFDEFYSIGLFTKDFVDPIETVRTIADVDVETSYRNAQSATSVGLEAGFRKNLQSLWPNLQNYYFSGNFALIDSSITLDKNAPENQNDQFIPFLTTETRPMQGQSPYVFNLQWGYDNFFTRSSAIFLYNVYGERISALGINGNPDVYEQPFKKLDFVMKWGLNDTYDVQVKKIGYTLSFKANNLMDSEVVETQGGVTSLVYKPGRSYSLSLSMKF